MTKTHNLWSTKIVEYKLNNIELKNDLSFILHNLNKQQDGTQVNIFKTKTPFTSWVIECAKDYCKDIIELTDLEINRGWVMCMQYGDDNDVHSHHPQHIAAVYYVEADPSIHSDLEVIDPRAPHVFNNTTKINKYGQKSNGFRSIGFKPETGKLILMPGYLLHYVKPNMSEVPRISLAMNINIKM